MPGCARCAAQRIRLSAACRVQENKLSWRRLPPREESGMLSELHIKDHAKRAAARLLRPWSPFLYVEELEVSHGAARIDFALIGSAIIGVEIKSPLDDLSRLDSQATHYNSYFEYLILAVADDQLNAATTTVPEFWGLVDIRVRNDRPFYTQVRPAKRNQAFQATAFTELLWRVELEKLFSKFCIPQLPIKAPKQALRERLIEWVEKSQLKAETIELLSQRTTWRASLLHATT